MVQLVAVRPTLTRYAPGLLGTLQWMKAVYPSLYAKLETERPDLIAKIHELAPLQAQSALHGLGFSWATLGSDISSAGNSLLNWASQAANIYGQVRGVTQAVQGQVQGQVQNAVQNQPPAAYPSAQTGAAPPQAPPPTYVPGQPYSTPPSSGGLFGLSTTTLLILGGAAGGLFFLLRKPSRRRR